MAGTGNLPATPGQRSWPRRLLNRLEVGQAVFFAVLLRVWQLLAGLVTLLLMVRYFSQEVQGMYYAFASVIAIQTFFELGLNIVIVNQCSHEWSELAIGSDGKITGAPHALSRLVSLGRQLFGWYGAASLLFVIATTTVGTKFLTATAAEGVNWEWPWILVAIFSGVLLWTLPFNAVLEGCNQVASVNRFRLVQAAMANLSVWAVMAAGGGLWAAVAGSVARVTCDLLFLLVRYRNFFAPFWQATVTATVAWRSEIWPLQWRLAVGAIFGYFGYFLFVPVMLWYEGTVVAGQMGMTWTVVTAIQAAALAWVQTRAPLFGMLVRQGDRTELDRVFFRVSTLGVAAYVVAAVPFWLLICGFHFWQLEVRSRLLQPAATAAFLAAALVQIITSSAAFYVRAHKQEPFLWVGVISNLAAGAAVWQLGSRFGPLGAGVGLLTVNLLITLPTHLYLWQSCRALGAGSTQEEGTRE